MKLTKQRLLQRACDLTIELKSNTGITLLYKGQRTRGNAYTLAILDVFSAPATLEAGLAMMNARLKGTQSWLELTAHITELYQRGILQSPELHTPQWHSHSGRFDAFPVHIRMLNDRHRTESYQRAIRETVRADDIVVDIGTGTGILAATAALAGAKHVYAIERSSVARLAEQVFEVNGLSNRITVIQGHSTQIDLPARANLMISELIGNDPLQEQVLQTTADAVKRLLQPGARLIPSILNIYALPVAVPADKLKARVFTADAVEQWQAWYGIDFSPLAQASRKQSHSTLVNTYDTRDWLAFGDPILVAELDLRTSHLTDICSQHRFQAQASGALNGMIVYFELQLGTAQFSIHPEAATPHNSWASKVWIAGEPIALQANDAVELTYRYGASGSDFDLQRVS